MRAAEYSGWDTTGEMPRADAVVIPFPSNLASVSEFEEDPVWQMIYLGESLSATIALLFLLPVFLVLSATIAYLSGNAPFIAHRRVGQGDKPIWVYKFRTMWGPETRGTAPGLVQYIISEVTVTDKTPKVKQDARIASAFAKMLRKYSIDELPQLWNVAMGDMSFVGPRPITSSEFDIHYREKRALVVSTKPGISGLWQVRGRSSLSYQQRVECDVEWVRTRTPSLYFETLARTIPTVCGAKNAW